MRTPQPSAGTQTCKTVSFNSMDLPLLHPIPQKPQTGAYGWCRLQGTPVTLLQHQFPVPNTWLLLCHVIATKPWHWCIPSLGDFWAWLVLVVTVDRGHGWEHVMDAICVLLVGPSWAGVTYAAPCPCWAWGFHAWRRCWG